jgi:hypothetical protein
MSEPAGGHPELHLAACLPEVGLPNAIARDDLASVDLDRPVAVMPVTKSGCPEDRVAGSWLAAISKRAPRRPTEPKADSSGKRAKGLSWSEGTPRRCRPASVHEARTVRRLRCLGHVTGLARRGPAVPAGPRARRAHRAERPVRPWRCAEPRRRCNRLFLRADGASR